MHRRLLLLLSSLLLFACAPQAAPVPPANPYQLREPFLSAWAAAGGEALGPPLSAPLWIDGREVQLFAQARIIAGEQAGALVDSQPPNWQARLPAELLSQPAAAIRASLSLTGDLQAERLPLQPTDITISAPGYDGPAELRLYDAELQLAGTYALELGPAPTAVAVMPRGAPGPQWAVLLIDQAVAAAQSQLLALRPASHFASNDPQLTALFPRMREFIEGARISYELNGTTISGYRSPDNPLLWLRDHVYQGRGFRYFERDVTSALDAFRAAQLPDGSLPDVLDYPERFVSAFRKEVESDLEFLYVQGVYEAYQLTGDDAWLRSHLEPMRRAIGYITSDPLRWDAERGLVRRPYTIDMWDFAYGPTTISPDGKAAPRHWIEADTIWGIFHGDNTGLIHALNRLAAIERLVGEPTAAEGYEAEAAALKQRLDDLSWNGRFYTHFVPLDPSFQPVGVDPASQLSLSNAYVLNRDLLNRDQGQKIVQSYYDRRDFSRAFAEWYSIDPPFPAGSYGMGGGKGENPGEYVNGGIMPIVGGELAQGAFRYGFEAYGFDILRRYAALSELTGESYLWYYPDGRPGISGPDTIPSDGWGTGAMLAALLVGAGGIEDDGALLRSLVLSPRWAADPALRDVTVVAHYPASGAYTAYRWQREANGLRLDLTGTGEAIYLRLLLPSPLPTDLTLRFNGSELPFGIDQVGASHYLDLQLPQSEGLVEVSWAAE